MPFHPKMNFSTEFNHKSGGLITICACSTRIDEDLDDNLWVQIFKRLPIECLCRLRSVCKGWNSLISSSFFVNLRHSFASSASQASRKSFLRHPVYKPESYAIHRPLQETTNPLHFPFPLLNDVPYDVFFSFVNVIHGVICVSYSKDSFFESTILWNPAIHKFKVLPIFPLPLEFETLNDSFLLSRARYNCYAIGFGYDHCKNDFKVVRIWIPTASLRSITSLAPFYEIYSSKQDLWRRVTIPYNSIPPCEVDHLRGTCFVNGSIHWLVRTYPRLDKLEVLMFDCESEQVKTMELPEEIYYDEMTRSYSHMVHVLEYGGMLSVLVCFPFMEHCRGLEMWVMVGDAWKKAYRIPDQDGYLELEDVDVFQPSFQKLAPYGPNQWIKFNYTFERFEEITCLSVYEESLFLMDDTKSQSYTKGEIVSIFN